MELTPQSLFEYQIKVILSEYNSRFDGAIELQLCGSYTTDWIAIGKAEPSSDSNNDSNDNSNEPAFFSTLTKLTELGVPSYASIRVMGGSGGENGSINVKRVEVSNVTIGDAPLRFPCNSVMSLEEGSK